MLGLMAHSVRHGHLCKMNSPDPMQPEDLAKFLGQPVDGIMRLLQELEGNGVFSRTCDGLIYSRRLLKDAKTRKRNCRYNFKRRQNETITHSPQALSKYVRSVPDERLETKDQNKENRDQRTQTESIKSNAEIHKPTALTQSTSENALEVKGLVNGLVGGKVVPKHPRPSFEQFINWGRKLGLNEDLLKNEHTRMQGRNWLDYYGQPINDVFTYLNSVSARLRKEGIGF
jgi:hypothetical protein